MSSLNVTDRSNKHGPIRRFIASIRGSDDYYNREFASVIQKSIVENSDKIIIDGGEDATPSPFGGIEPEEAEETETAPVLSPTATEEVEQKEGDLEQGNTEQSNTPNNS